MKTVALLSGGLDSSTALAIAVNDGYEPYALSFHYGQRHKVELDSAKLIAKSFNAKEHIIVDIDLRKFGGSALTGNLEVPKHRSEGQMETGIPITYVPARNTIFLSYALAWAEALNCRNIHIGVNVLDYSGYPDCRPEYIEAFEKMANLATKASVEGKEKLSIHTPLINLTKAEIIKKGIQFNVDYSHTISCYDPSPEGEPCYHCDSCQLRSKGFSEIGIKDPLIIKFRGPRDPIFPA